MFKSVWQREGQRRHAEVQYDLVCYRVYDNAKANAVMQKCIMILSFWEGMSNEACLKFLDHIQNECSPFKDEYDDDMTDTEGQDLQKVTIQIKVSLCALFFFLRDWCKTVVTCNTTLRWYNRFAPRPLFSVLNMVIVMVNFYKNAG